MSTVTPRSLNVSLVSCYPIGFRPSFRRPSMATLGLFFDLFSALESSPLLANLRFRPGVRYEVALRQIGPFHKKRRRRRRGRERDPGWVHEKVVAQNQVWGPGSKTDNVWIEPSVRHALFIHEMKSSLLRVRSSRFHGYRSRWESA